MKRIRKAGPPRTRKAGSARPPRSAGGVSPARLMAEAEIARRSAYAPYSRFSVGAALLTRDGAIVHGCNVENASFGLSICAERNAVWQAVAAGMRDFVAVAVTAGPDQGASPCGACRQVLHEFAPYLWVYFRAGGGRIVRERLDALLTHGFDLTTARRRPASRRAPARAASRRSRGGSA